MPEGDAQRIRRYLCEKVASARERGDETIIFCSGDVHKALDLTAAMRNVCQVLKGRMFHEEAGVERVRTIKSPPSGEGATLIIRVPHPVAVKGWPGP